jgi:hypothetical protein
MVILRPTQKLRSLLPFSSVTPMKSDTALGDWYINRLVVNRRPLLILVSSVSLLPMLLPARGVRELPRRLAGLVEGLLRRRGIAACAVDAEKEAMTSVSIGPTLDRSVLGIMVDFAKLLPHYLEPGRWDETTLLSVEARLAQIPCYAGRRFEEVIFPEKKAAEVLHAKWGIG